jgi:pyruvate/2-oxoglutarate dehydrogenase complex dihydrolipoamide acyltransferase (E2) component
MTSDQTGKRVAIRLPQSGTQTAATFLEWTSNVGDQVEVGDAIASAETDKATVDIEAPVGGTLVEMIARPQQEIETDTVLGFIAADAAAAPTVKPEPVSSRAVEQGSREEVRALTLPLRRAAENLQWVVEHTARAATTVEVDFEAVAALRAGVAGSFPNGRRPTYLPFIAFAAIQSLRRSPEIAGRIDLEAITLTIPKDVHLGIAVARESGLIVPVIRNAERLDFLQLAASLQEAADKVRDGRFTNADVQGGTFTISNPGVFGSYLSSPIMNRGETSILCVDAVEHRAVIIDGKVVPRLRGFFTLAFDHRVVDGMRALSFLNDIKRQLESCDQAWTEGNAQGGDGSAEQRR